MSELVSVGGNEMMNGFAQMVQTFVNASNEERDEMVRALMTRQVSFGKELAALQASNEEIREQQQTIKDEVRRVKDLLLTVSLTSGQRRNIQKAAGRQSHAAAEIDKQSVRQHYANIYTALWDRYSVSSYADIPRDKYQEAMRMVSEYDGSSKNWWRE